MRNAQLENSHSQRIRQQSITSLHNTITVMHDNYLDNGKSLFRYLGWKPDFVHPPGSRVYTVYLMFKAALKRYFEGVGHVDHPDLRESGLVTELMISQERGNASLRAELFIHAITDGPTLLNSSDGEITVSNRATCTCDQQLTGHPPDSCQTIRGFFAPAFGAKTSMLPLPALVFVISTALYLDALSHDERHRHTGFPHMHARS